jgi:hypothetical protein
MTLNKAIFLVLVNLIPFLFLLLQITDLFEVVNSPESYPFGHSINATSSIYTSSTIYIMYCLIQVVFLFALIGLSFFYKKYTKVYLTFLAVNFLLFIYPIITMRD